MILHKPLDPTLWIELYNRICGFIPETQAMALQVLPGVLNPGEVTGDFLYLGTYEGHGTLILVWSSQGLLLETLSKGIELPHSGRPMGPQEWEDIHNYFLGEQASRSPSGPPR